jgi:hypothetical protein
LTCYGVQAIYVSISYSCVRLDKSKEYEFGTSIKYFVIFQMSCPAGFLIMKILLKELCTKDKDAIINDDIRLS